MRLTVFLLLHDSGPYVAEEEGKGAKAKQTFFVDRYI